jgi:hypothetical protein
MDATPEEWRPVVGYGGIYEVSNHGRVRSLERLVPHCQGGQRRISARMLKLTVSSTTGYRVVNLRDAAGGRPSSLQSVHRLVLAAFAGPCPPGMEACHNDGDKINNHVSNLRWDTQSANNIDTVNHGGNHNANKTHCPRGHRYDVVYHVAGHGQGRQRACRRCIRDRTRRIREEQNAAEESL